MTIGLGTPDFYVKEKKEAIEGALKKFGVEADIVLNDSFKLPSKQTFGFEELIRRAKRYAAGVFENQSLNVDIGVGIENSLSFIYSAQAWYYVICVAVCTKDGKEAVSFTPGIEVSQLMMQEVQKDNVELDVLTKRLAGEDDPVLYFSGKTLTREELVIPALLLAFSKVGIEKYR